eukprot:SAG31_NODE_4899_length_2878_cov_1.365599_5_plen_178_part_00
MLEQTTLPNRKGYCSDNGQMHAPTMPSLSTSCQSDWRTSRARALGRGGSPGAREQTTCAVTLLSISGGANSAQECAHLSSRRQQDPPLVPFLQVVAPLPQVARPSGWLGLEVGHAALRVHLLTSYYVMKRKPRARPRPRSPTWLDAVSGHGRAWGRAWKGLGQGRAGQGSTAEPGAG